MTTLPLRYRRPTATPAVAAAASSTALVRVAIATVAGSVTTPVNVGAARVWATVARLATPLWTTGNVSVPPTADAAVSRVSCRTSLFMPIVRILRFRRRRRRRRRRRWAGEGPLRVAGRLGRTGGGG